MISMLIKYYYLKKVIMHIYNDDKELFRKCIEIWGKIIELIGINSHIYVPKADEDNELFIMADAYKNTVLSLKIIIDVDIIKL